MKDEYVVGIESKLDCLIGLVNSMVELQSLILESQSFLLLSPAMRAAETERYQNWLKRYEEIMVGKKKDICSRLDDMEKCIQAIEEAISSLQSEKPSISQVESHIAQGLEEALKQLD